MVHKGKGLPKPEEHKLHWLRCIQRLQQSSGNGSKIRSKRSTGNRH